jgi:hypothetical protein
MMILWHSARWQVLKKYARRSLLLSERKLPEQKEVDAFYRLRLRKGLPHSELVRELSVLGFITGVNWFSRKRTTKRPVYKLFF